MAILKETSLVTFSSPAAHDLDSQGQEGSARYTERVGRAIQDNLIAIVSEAPIITADGQGVVSVPIRDVELPHFRHQHRQEVGFAQAAGIGKRPIGGSFGATYHPVDVPMGQVEAVLLKELGFPNLPPKSGKFAQPTGVVFDGHGRRGVMANLDSRRTVFENIKRNALSGRGGQVADIRSEDMRFKTSSPALQKDSNAVVIAMRDVSGSMGEFQKYMARSFYFWMVKFLRAKYDTVQIVFITHHTEAQEVDEQGFFRPGEGGGTKVSSAYKLALKTIESRFNPNNNWSVYPFHFSDGDNWSDADNKLSVGLLRQLLANSKMFGYGEVRQYERSDTVLMSALKAGFLKDPRFMTRVLRTLSDVTPALMHFFRSDMTETREGRVV